MPPKKAASLKDFFEPAAKKQRTTKAKKQEEDVDDGDDDEQKTPNDDEDNDGDRLVKLPKPKKDPSGGSKSDADGATPEEIFASKPTTVSYATLEDALPPSWKKALSKEFTKPYWAALKKKLEDEEKKGAKIWPKKEDIFNAFWACPEIDDIKVFLLGQDPYPTAKVAMGLAFSTNPTTPVPGSLKNIYKELETDIPGFKTPKHGDLSKWALQGVFLLNTVLTVTEGQANSHKAFGWLEFTTAICELLLSRTKLVWLMWGAQAHGKTKKVDKKNNLVICETHPSPLSAYSKTKPFFGSKSFSKINKYLNENGLEEINWQV